MNRIYAAAVALPLALAGCQPPSGGPVVSTIPATTEQNAVACMGALLASGSFDPATLALAAAANPACEALAAAVLSDIIGRVVPHNAALARAQGRLR
jgi:hypothetical protein